MTDRQRIETLEKALAELKRELRLLERELKVADEIAIALKKESHDQARG